MSHTYHKDKFVQFYALPPCCSLPLGRIGSTGKPAGGRGRASRERARNHPRPTRAGSRERSAQERSGDGHPRSRRCSAPDAGRMLVALGLSWRAAGRFFYEQASPARCPAVCAVPLLPAVSMSIALSRPFVPQWRVHPFSGILVLGSPFMWKYRRLPSSMFSMLLVAYPRPSNALVSIICTTVRSAPRSASCSASKYLGFSSAVITGVGSTRLAKTYPIISPAVRPFPSSNGWICMKRWFSPQADLRSVSNSSARLPSVGSPPSQRGDCAPVTVTAFNPLLPFSCSVVPGSFRATSACRACSSSLTTPCAGVSSPTTEFQRESRVDGSLIQRPAHLVRRTAGLGPTRECRRCDKTRAHRPHCRPAFGARHGSNP